MVVRPLMRGFQIRRFKKDIIGTVILCTIAVTLHRTLVVIPHKQRYADFYKNFDGEAVFQDMRKKGCFDSAPPDED